MGEFSGSGGSGTGAFGDCGVAGCMDATACNYNVDATTDDGSCLQDLGCGCGEPAAAAGFNCDGSCIEGSNLTVDGGFFQYEISWTITDCDGNEILTGGAPFSGCVTLPDNYNITMTDSYGDGWNGNVMSFEGAVIAELASGSEGTAGYCPVL